MDSPRVERRCVGASGDFALPGTLRFQALHSDMSFRKSLNVQMPPPLISANFVVQPLTAMNGPMRLVPGLWNHAAPEPEAGDMKRQRLYPVPAGAVLLRDVRVLHGGTPNFSQEVRFLPSILLCSGAAAAAGRFKQDWPTLPRQLFDTLRSDVQALCENLIGEVGNPT